MFGFCLMEPDCQGVRIWHNMCLSFELGKCALLLAPMEYNQLKHEFIPFLVIAQCLKKRLTLVPSPRLKSASLGQILPLSVFRSAL